MSIDAETQTRFDTGLEAVERKDWNAAADAFWAACRRTPNNIHILFNLANARLQAGDKSGALWAVTRGLGVDPAFRNLRLLAGNVCTELGDYKTAVDHYVEAVRADPQNATLQCNLAAALERLGLFEEAFEVYEFAVQCGGERSALYSAMHHVASHACRWDLSARVQRLLDTYFEHGGRNYAAPFQLLCMNSTRSQQLEAAKNYAARTFTEQNVQIL